ncbi:unnamed protein product [Schistosoma margrebowiei]|uniref:Uncharacterized protein n=1 Tax=Schistosoma margrebowiei TaxID=48269 RepID=A0A183MU33_9TREM|nr:unnamed protein product [Schistosoma margrebowiei]
MCLGSIIDGQGSNADVKARIGKARAAFLQLRNIWDPKRLSASRNQIYSLHYGYQKSSTVRIPSATAYCVREQISLQV